MRSPRLAAIELSRLANDSRLTRAAVVAITLVPLLYGALYLWAFWDPYGNLDKIPVALVNADAGATVDGKRVTAGSDLVDELLDRSTFEWHVVPAEEASSGVAAGRYYLSLSIPRDFSADLATANTEHPVRARLHAVAHESSNMIASQIAGRVFSEVRAAAASSASQGYFDEVFVGFADAADGLADAADSAGELASGLADAHDGAHALASGTTDARDGAITLASGLDDLAAGASKADAGARSVASGNRSLAGGLADARTGAGKVADGAGSLAGGSAQLESALGTLDGGARGLATSASQLSAGAAQLDAAARDAAAKAGVADEAAGRLRDGAESVDDALQAYAAAHPDAASDPYLAGALAGSAQVRSGSADLASGLHDAVTSLPLLTGASTQVSAGAAQLSAGAARLAGGVSQVASGSRALSAGASDLADGTERLSAGVASASSGAARLADGSSALAAGTKTLAAGSSDAAAGGGDLAAGIERLDEGTHDLATGLGSALSGSRELASGLTAGVEKLPSLDESARDANAAMMADPVALDTQRLGAVPTYGTGFTPYFVPLALWIGALLVFFLVRPLPQRALASGAPAPVTAFSGYLPAALIAAAQAAILVAVVRFGLGLSPIRPLAFYAFALLTALVFVAILQMLGAAFGAVGKLASIILLMLQLTSSAGTFPLQTVPRFFQAINPYLPMTYVVSGLRQAVSGGDMRVLAFDAAVLALFGLASLVGTMLAARRDQVWTMERLHPSFEL